MEKNYIGIFPTGSWHYKGTLAEIRAVQGPEGSLGHPTDSRLELRYRNGAWEALENGDVNLDTGAEQVPGAVSASGDGGTQGGFIGTWDDEAALPATATPGSFATTRNGKSYVFAAEG